MKSRSCEGDGAALGQQGQQNQLGRDSFVLGQQLQLLPFQLKNLSFEFVNRKLVSAYQAVHLIQEGHECWPAARFGVRAQEMISLMIPENADEMHTLDMMASPYHSWQLFKRDSRKVSFLSLSMIEMQNLAAVSAIFWLSTTLVKICRTSSIRDRPDSLIRFCHPVFIRFQIDEYVNACIFQQAD